MFNLSYFTHKGSIRPVNQDRLLVQDKVYSKGIFSLNSQKSLFCFVSDGIGGNVSGDFAAEFVLNEMVKRISIKIFYDESDLVDIFKSINHDLLKQGMENENLKGMGTTLSGIIHIAKQTYIINVGDSQIWLFRNNSFFRVSEDQVLNSLEENSPLISYFGGFEDNLQVQFCNNLRKLIAGDVLLITTDGLLKSVDQKQVKAILANENAALDYKAEFLLQTALRNRAEDNLGCILIEVLR